MALCSVFWAVILLATANSVHGGDACTGLPGLLNCAPFLLGSVSSPDAKCCKSLKWLSQHAINREDKRELCKCLKVEDLKHKGVILDRAKALPRLCKVQLPVPLVPDNKDCDKIKAADEEQIEMSA